MSDRIVVRVDDDRVRVYSERRGLLTQVGGDWVRRWLDGPPVVVDDHRTTAAEETH